MEAPYKPVTVIYGTLNLQDSVHYIRIEKAFVAGTGSPYSGMQSLDSNYADALAVSIQEIDRRGLLVADASLERVNMAQEGLGKTPGLFFSNANYLYRLKKRLAVDKLYRVLVKHLKTGIVDSAQTWLVDTAGMVILEENLLNLETDSPVHVQIKYFSTSNKIKEHIPVAARGYLRINYVETDELSGKVSKHFIPYDFHMPPSYYPSGAKFFASQDPQKFFYGLIIAATPPTAPNIKRHLVDCDIFTTAYAENLQNFVNAGGAQGLSDNMIRPLYTNINSTGDAIGIFSSQTMHSLRHRPIHYSLDTLNALPGADTRNFR